MTETELTEFLAEVRTECDERLAMLAAVDPATLPLALRAEYDSALRSWTALRELTEGDAHEFHLAVSEELGREMTAAELPALLGLTPPLACALTRAGERSGASPGRPSRGSMP